MSPEFGTAHSLRPCENQPVTAVGGADGRACAPIAGRPANRSWGTWFERALGFVYAIVVVNNIVISTDFLTSTVEATTTAGAVAVLVGTGALLWSAVMIALGRRSPWVVYPTVTILLGAQFVVVAAVTDPGRMPSVWWAWQLMVPVFVLVVGVLPARSATWVVAVAGAGYLAVRTAPASGASAGWHSAVSELSLALVFVVLTVVFVPAWRQTAAIADEAARTQHRAFAETEAARAVDRQERAASRLLHDEVIHALRAKALPAGAIEQARVRPMVAHAAELLRHAVPGVAGELTALADRSGLSVTLRLTGNGRLTIDHMASSIRRSEELERHARATAAQLRVSRDVLGARLGRVREWVLPFLIAVQDGRVGLDSPATRREASTLEAAVRDDIRLGPQIDAGARELIARARRDGRTVEIIADSDVPPALPAGLVSRLLTAALAGPEPPRRTVLTVSGARTRVVSLMVSPVPREPVLVGVAEELRARILHGPDFLLVRVDLATATAVVSPQVGTSVAAGPRIGWAA